MRSQSEGSRIALSILVATVVLTGIVATTGGGAAQSAEPTPTLTCGTETYDVDIATAVSLYNANTDAVPGPIASVISTNTTEIRIENASQKRYTATTDGNMQIVDTAVGPGDEPDVIVKTDRDTACALYTANKPVEAFETAYNNGEITVEATNPVDSAKVYIVDKVVGVLGL